MAAFAAFFSIAVSSGLFLALFLLSCPLLMIRSLCGKLYKPKVSVGRPRDNGEVNGQVNRYVITTARSA